MNEFHDVSMEEMNQVEGGFVGGLVDAVSRISTGIGSLVGKGVDLLGSPSVPPSYSPPCNSAPCPTLR